MCENEMSMCEMCAVKQCTKSGLSIFGFGETDDGLTGAFVEEVALHRDVMLGARLGKRFKFQKYENRINY